jgi:serine/threonine protein phosphatase 1
MATIAVGDIHGHLPPLKDLLGQLEGEISEGDVVVFLGDYIDRGPDTKGCVDAILRFEASVPAAVVCLCGNHEDWLLRTLRDYRRHSWLLGMEAFETIGSYSAAAVDLLRAAAAMAGPRLVLGDCALPYETFVASVPEAHLVFFGGLLPYCRTADCVCVHGGLDPAGPEVEQQKREALVWGTDRFPDGYRGSETIVYGHQNDPELDPEGWPKPRVIGRTIGVDTISHGVLTAMRLPDRRVFQSSRYAVSGPDV